MKKILSLFAALALLTVMVHAQRELTRDSLGALTNTGGVFFQTRYLAYDNGEAETFTTRIGDSSTVNNFLTNQAIEAGNAFAQAAIIVLQRGTVVNRIRDINTAMTGATGRSTLDAMRALYYTQLVDTVGVDKAYTWRNGAVTDINIRYLANGNLRFSGLPGISGATRNGDMLGANWLRINNFPTGSNAYLYRLKDGRWLTIDRTLELRRAGLNVQNQGQ
jgi:hypothetical protein